MKVGTLAYATEQGLGILAKMFFDAGVVTDVFVVRHAHRPTRDEWYPGAPSEHIRQIGSSKAVREFVAGVDAMLFFETPFDWGLISFCKDKGIKTVLMPMFECMPNRLPTEPDVIVCPSLLDLRYYPRGVFIPVPADPLIKWRLRERALTFVHSAGHGGLLGRNGTGVLIDAIRLAKSPFKMILMSQEKLQWDASDPRVEVNIGSFPREALYDDGDVFVFPERFNGLSLPLQEAHAAGMAVIATDRFPMNTWLPSAPLIPVKEYRKNRISSRCLEFNEAVIDPQALADCMDRWYGADIEELSCLGRVWANENSWERLRLQYMEVLS